MELKLCGITTEDDAYFADEVGFDYIGFIFHKGSKRLINRDFVKRIKTKNVKKVGVFVDTSFTDIADIVYDCSLDMVQLHGDQDIEFLDELSSKVTRDDIMRCFWPNRYQSISSLYEDMDRFNIDNYIFDSGLGGGGHGRVIDLSGFSDKSQNNLSEYRKNYKRNFIAGGINSNNIKEIVKSSFFSVIRPTGLDINSGVEKSPGKKDKNKIIEFLDTLKEIDYYGK